MAALTEESFNKLNKPDSVALVVSLQSKMDSVNNDLVAEQREWGKALIKWNQTWVSQKKWTLYYQKDPKL